MKKIIYIFVLLYISIVSWGQDTPPVMHNGVLVRMGADGFFTEVAPEVAPAPQPEPASEFEGKILYAIEFDEQGTTPFESTTTTARGFFPGVIADNFWRWGPGTATWLDSNDSIVSIGGDMAWRITMNDIGAGQSSYGTSWIVYMEDSAFGNMQVDFDLMLSDDWDMWDCSRGGKLPGFGASDSVGGSPPTGSGYSGYPGEGYSVREAFGINEEIGTYNYLAQMTPHTPGLSYYPYSTNGVGPFVYDTETWYHITGRATQNTIGLSDGYIEMGLNGTIVMEMSAEETTGLKFRLKEEINMNYILAAVFAGGEVYECFEDMTAWIDNLVYSVPEDDGLIGLGNTIGSENIPYTESRVASINGVKGMFDENYMAIQPAQDDDLWLIPAEVWGDKWLGTK